MTTNSYPPRSSNGRGSDGPMSGISPAALAVAVGRNWRLVLATTVSAVLAALAFGLLRPPVYSAKVLVYMSQGAGDARSQLAAAFPLAALAGAGSNSNTKLVTTVLGSRSLADSVIKRTGEPRDVRVQNNSDGSIEIEVEHRDPEMAARIANTYPPVLNTLVSRTGAQTSRQKVAVLERQIAAVRAELEASEDRLVRFQSGQNAAAVEEQASATLTAAVQLQQRISEREVALATLRRTATLNNPQLRTATAELAAMRQQLRQLSSGGGASPILVPLRDSPGLKVGATRLLREFARNEQVYIALSGALAQTQIDLTNSLPVVTVIDPALVPDVPRGPGLPVMLGVSAVLGVVAGILLAIVLESVRNARRDPDHDPFLAVWKGIRADDVPPRHASAPR